MSWTATLDASKAIRQMAELKKVPVSKVVRNAVRDFLAGAMAATPVATPVLPRKAAPGSDPKKALYWFFTDPRNGWQHYVPYSYLQGRKRASLRRIGAKLVPVRTGWSAATWIGAMQDMGMGRRAPRSKKISYAPSRSHAYPDPRSIKGDEAGFWVITDKLPDFLFHPGVADKVREAGFRRALDIMDREIRKMIRQAAAR